MSSDNFDLRADDGRIWQNLGASQYEDISAEAIVVCMELENRPTSTTYSDYTEYGVTVAGEVTDKHRLEAVLFMVRQQQWQIQDLWQHLDEIEVEIAAAGTADEGNQPPV